MPLLHHHTALYRLLIALYHLLATACHSLEGKGLAQEYSDENPRVFATFLGRGYDLSTQPPVCVCLGFIYKGTYLGAFVVPRFKACENCDPLTWVNLGCGVITFSQPQYLLMMSQFYCQVCSLKYQS